MNKTTVSVESFLNYILKIIAPMLALMGICGSSYWNFYLEPKIEERLKPLTIFVLETNLIVKKMAPDSIKMKVRDELRSYEQYIFSQSGISH